MVKRIRIVLIVCIMLVATFAVVRDGVAGRGGKQAKQVGIGDVAYIDMVTFETGTQYEGTDIGGFSGITYDPARKVYYVLSDDRSEFAPSRYYTVAIDVDGGELSVDFKNVTFLRNEEGELFEPFELDPESVTLGRPGQLFISTEGDDDTSPLSDPEIMRFNPVGMQTGEFPVPSKFLYTVDDDNHVRDNLGFESLTVSPNRALLYAAIENALINDGPISTLQNGSPARFIVYKLARRLPLHEYVYCVDPIPRAPVPADAFADHGLVEIIALDNQGTFLAMERSFAVGVGNTILLYETSLEGATDVAGVPALGLDGCPVNGLQFMSKTLVADLGADFGISPDNVEGMAFGPWLSETERLLILVSDNNFNPSQTTQFIALRVELVTD